MQWGPGYEMPQTYWRNTPSASKCAYCHTNHNQSLHGHLGLCNAIQNPAVHGWLQAWAPLQRLIWAWRESASPRSRFLLGKLAIPNDLYRHLAEHFPRNKVLTIVNKFYRTVPKLLLHLHLPPHRLKLDQNRRLNPYREEDWTAENHTKQRAPRIPPNPTVRPQARRNMAPPTTKQPT